MEITDNVIPSSNSEMAKNLFYLGHFFSDDAEIKMAYRAFGEKKFLDAAIKNANFL
jgi:uncharacterized protein YyaL (SSP411 family)